MSVDLQKISAVCNALKNGDLDYTKGTVYCLERCALKKSWSKQPSYWIDLLFCSETGYYQVFKYWSWIGKDKLVKEGRVPHKGSTKDNHTAVCNYFCAIEAKMISGGWGVSERQHSAATPVRDFDKKIASIKNNIPAISTPIIEVKPVQDKKEPKKLLSRKPVKDWF